MPDIKKKKMELTSKLEERLEIIGFDIHKTDEASVVLVSALKEDNQTLSPEQLIALEKAKILGADAVFFRYFGEGRPPQAQVYIYDNTSEKLTNYTQIHKQLWSDGTIALFIVIELNYIKFFDSRNPIGYRTDSTFYSDELARIDLDNLEQYTAIIEKYNAEQFKNGSFWEQKDIEPHFLNAKSAYNQLIEKLQELRRDYHRDTNITPALYDYLIIITMLIKFLEENAVDANGNNLADNFFQKTVGCSSFIEILKQNKLVELLSALSEKFNGGIFHLSVSDKVALSCANLSNFVSFFDTKRESSGQLCLWDLYDFKHIPTELISNIYEEFLPKEEKGSVYTPSYLVSFLIDEVLPLSIAKTSASFMKKCIDVSCGSGIFLVNCFKRLVEIYKLSQYRKTHIFPEKVEVATLQKILKENVFGVDINKTAVELTKFSLQLALCRMLSPQQIWTSLVFQDLGKENIVHKDFFEFVSDNKQQKQYDIVIGNPPFNPPFVDNKGVGKQYFDEIITRYNISTLIGDKNIALLFLELSTKLLHRNGCLCLIQPSLPLLHKKGNEVFRKSFFTHQNVVQIIDFTPMRRVLFPSATIPVCALFIKNSDSKTDRITHIVVRRTQPSAKRLYFEIDTYDIHQVAKEHASLGYAWKCNLFGGYRLFSLINHIVANSKYKRVKEMIGAETQTAIKNYSLLKIIEHNSFPDTMKKGKLKKYLSEHFAFCVAYIAGTSTRQGIDRPYDVLKSSFLELPIIAKDTLTLAEQIVVNDIATYKVKEFGRGEAASTNEVLKISNTKQLPIVLQDYIAVYIEALNSALADNKQKFSLKSVYNTPACLVMVCQYTDTQENYHFINTDTIDISPLVEMRKKTLHINKVTIIFQKNQVLIIKPKQLRYWLKSTALLDADITLSDIIKLNLLN